MIDTMTIITSLLGAGSVGGIAGAFFQSHFKRRADLSKEQGDLKQKRYLCIILLMLTRLSPNTWFEKLKSIRPDLQNPNHIDDEIRMELANGIIYAGTDVLLYLGVFLATPTYKGFVDCVVAMRVDLWGKSRGTDSWLRTLGTTLILRGDPSKGLMPDALERFPKP
jgi:hypothetical protein